MAFHLSIAALVQTSMSRIDFWNFGKTQHLKKIPMKISSVVVMCQFLCILFHCRLNIYASLFLRLFCKEYITFRQQKLHFLTLDFLQCYQKVSFAFLLVSVSVGEVEAEDEETPRRRLTWLAGCGKRWLSALSQAAWQPPAPQPPPPKSTTTKHH